MGFPPADRLAALLAGTGVTSLELSGPQGHLRLDNTRASADLHIEAPGPGRFLHAHPITGTPLAPDGALVEEGSVIGLLQVGVLLMPLLAPCAGRICAHLAANGALVGYGMALIALRPHASEVTP